MPHSKTTVALALLPVAALLVAVGCTPMRQQASPPAPPPAAATGLTIQYDEQAGTIAVFRAGGAEALVTQHAPRDARPYLHPIAAPDGKGVLTEVSPSHHRHQTGLYWGFTRLNGRDYFHNPEGGTGAACRRR